MGIDHGSNLIAKMTNIVARELHIMNDFVRSKHASDDVSRDDDPPCAKTILCDVSNIIHKLSYHRSNIYSNVLVCDVANFLKQLAADSGYTIIPVLDGEVRPQSKRDAFQRRYDTVMARINSFFCRQSAMKLAAKPIIERTEEDKEHLDEYNKEAKRLESCTRLHIPHTFKEQLETALEESGAYFPDRSTGGFVSRDTIKAEFESDYIIAHHIQNKKGTLVYSTDADMVALCGPSCLFIRKFEEDKENKKKRKNGESEATVYTYEVTCGSNILMEEIKALVNTRLPMSEIAYTSAKFPLLEDALMPPYLIALLVVGLGCDVLPNGVSGVTPFALTKQLNKIYEEGVSPNDYMAIHNQLIDFYLKKEKTRQLTKDLLLTYCQAFLFQPALEEGSKSDPQAWNYVFSRPTELHPYLSMFVFTPDNEIEIHEEEEDNVNRDDTMKRCKGIEGINLPHDFLNAEESFTCTSCNQCFCPTCGYSPRKDRDEKKTKHSLIFYRDMNENICIDCYKQRIFLPYSYSLDDVLSVEEMKKYLRKNNNQMLGGHNDIKPHEVQELYEVALVTANRNTNAPVTVPFPICESKSLEMRNGKFGFGELVCSFHIQNGGQVINLPQITNDIVADVVNIFAKVVSFDKTSNGCKNDIGYDKPLLDVLPSMIINFANHSRVGSGYRLLKRCLRHSLDPRAFPLENTTAHLFKYSKDGEIGLVIRNKVTASMKDQAYVTKIAFTPTQVIAASCDCMAGGAKSERIICVHNLPLVYQLLMLLDDGLAEHLLVELCSRWDEELENTICANGKESQMRHNISILMHTAGKSLEQIRIASQQRTIKQMLDCVYATGTQRSKKIPTPPAVKDLRPIRDIDFASVIEKAKRRKQTPRIEADDENEPPAVAQNDTQQNNNTTILPPDYYEMFITAKAMGFNVENSAFPGFRLLAMRAQKAIQTKSESAVTQYIEYKRKMLKDIRNNTYKRIEPLRQSQIRTKKDPPPVVQPLPPPSASSTLCEPTNNIPVENKIWKRGPQKKCCFWKCGNNERTDANITRVTNLSAKKPNFETDRLRDVTRYIGRSLERQYTLKACAKKDEGRQYYLCTHHDMEKVTKKAVIERVAKNGRRSKCTITHTFQVPSGVGLKAAATPANKSKGLGIERANNRISKKIQEDFAHHHKNEAETDKYNDLVGVASDNTQLVLEIFARNDELEAENQRLRQEIEEHKIREEEKKKSCQYDSNDVKHIKRTAHHVPVISYEEMAANPSEVKRRTGFNSLENMLAFMIIVCNGDYNAMTYKSTSLTWLEEWYFYFEYVWGRTLNRWIDAAVVYKADKSSVRLIFKEKLQMIKECRQRWPQYATYEEDHTLTKQKWRDKFAGKRVVMWDDTNVNFVYKPSGANEQRLTYSPYYASNCAKGGVFIQLCGWLGVENLWCGATSDSHYQEMTKIFDKQNDFAKSDKVDGKIIPFTNILDKGYRVNVPAWRAGKQEILQPVFATSDKRFSAKDTIQIADVATTRSGNERGVNVTKRSGYIKRGIQPHLKAETMDDVWLAWSFQSNFMYKPVL